MRIDIYLYTNQLLHLFTSIYHKYCKKAFSWAKI